MPGVISRAKESMGYGNPGDNK